MTFVKPISANPQRIKYNKIYISKWYDYIHSKLCYFCAEAWAKIISLLLLFNILPMSHFLNRDPELNWPSSSFQPLSDCHSPGGCWQYWICLYYWFIIIKLIVLVKAILNVTHSLLSQHHKTGTRQATWKRKNMFSKGLKWLHIAL